jgi:NADPH2:quinone reductase
MPHAIQHAKDTANAVPATMHAAAIDKFSGPISIHTLPTPEADPGEVIIHVESAGLGVWDSYEQEGGFAKMMGVKPSFPYVLGSEAAGTIAEIGEGVDDFALGDRVYAATLMNPKGSAYAEYVAVKAESVSAIPGKLTVRQAGALVIDGVTGLVGLDNKLHLKRGESLLIFGASGGIGHLAVQLAKRMGARVLAVASGKDGVDLVKRLGADVAIDGHKEDVLAAARQFAPKGLDCILLTAGGKEAERSFEALAKAGRVAHPNGVEPAPQPRPGIKIENYDGEPTPENIKKLNELVEQGPFEVMISREFPLNQVNEAHQAMEKHFLGKFVLRPS